MFDSSHNHDGDSVDFLIVAGGAAGSVLGRGSRATATASSEGLSAGLTGVAPRIATLGHLSCE
jgi:hypothetical protein